MGEQRVFNTHMGYSDRRSFRRRHSHSFGLPALRAFIHVQEPGGHFWAYHNSCFFYVNFVGFVGSCLFLMIAGAEVFDWSNSDGTLLFC